MQFYDILTDQKSKTTESLYPEYLDHDVKQLTLLRVLNSYLNKSKPASTFEAFCRTNAGEAMLKTNSKYVHYDLVNNTRMKPYHKRNKDNMSNATLAPVSYNTKNVLSLVEAASESAETNINAVQKKMELREQVMDLYQTSGELKQRAMDLLVEAMDFKDSGQPIPSRIRMALSRLRTEIQQTDPSWKLDLHLL